MKILTKIITNPHELAEIEKDLDTFSNSYTKNPFMLYPFIKSAMQLNIRSDQIPIILVSKIDEKIIGLSQVLLKRHFGVRAATFLLHYWVSPDFIIDDKYRENVLNHILYVLLKEMRCKLITLDLPAESPNLQALEQACITNKVNFRKKTEQYMSHRVIPIQCSWDDFQKVQGKYFRQRFRYIERNLNNTGKWKITLVESTNNEESTNDTFKKILHVEKMSWKETLRSRVDEDLLWIWKSSSSATKTNSDFERKIWFLELNDQTLAFTLVIQYKGTAFIAKTSFAEQYRRLCLGLCVNNAAIKALFDEKEVKRIDFMTSVPFTRIWATTCLPRVRYIISEGIIWNLLEYTVRKLRRGKALAQNPLLARLVKFYRSMSNS